MSEGRSGWRALVSRLFGFAIVPTLSALSALVLLPLVARLGGSDGWTSLALGQTLGGVASVVAGLAWPFVGGHRIAVATLDYRRTTYAVSVLTRGAVLLVTILVATAYLAWVNPPHVVTTWVFMVGIAGNALSAAWYYAGVGSPRLLVLSEGIPRLLAYVGAVLLLLITHDILAYAIATVVFQIFAFLANHRLIFGTFAMPLPPRSVLFRELKEQSVGTVSRTATALGESGGPLFIAALYPQHLAVFTALDAVFKAGRNATSFTPSAFISWIGQAESRRQRVSRSQRSMLFVLCLCVPGIIVWQLAGGWILDFIYDSQVSSDPAVVALIGLSVFGSLIVYSAELLILIPGGHASKVFIAQLLTAVISSAALVVLSQHGALAAFSYYVLALALRAAYYILLVPFGRAGTRPTTLLE